jgi:serine/threonine-protein kinase RsbW
MPSDVKAISPLLERVIRLIEKSHCVAGEELAVELALREALNNAVVHGNRLDPGKLVQVYCRCELGKELSLVVRDQGIGFDPNGISDPLALKNLEAEHGRGILLMRSQMDEVSFERGGTEVHMHKTASIRAIQRSARESDNPSSRDVKGSADSDRSKQSPPMRPTEKNMLRISITENATEMRLVLQGRLTGLQVDELKTSWKAASQLLKGRACKVDIDQLTFIDKEGNRVLRAMSREGAQFVANDLYMRGVAEELKSGNGYGLSGMITSFLRLSRR